MQVSWARLKNNVRAEKQACIKIYEIFVVICILVVPITAVTRDSSIYGTQFKMCDLPGVWPVIFGAFAVMTMVLTHKLFREMNSSTDADVILSLPMTAKERYFSKVLTLARCILLPFVISMVLSAFASFLCDKFIFEIKSASFTYYFKGLFLYYSLGLCAIMFSAAVSFLCCSFASSKSVAAVTTLFVAAAAGLLPRLILEGLILTNANICFESGYRGYFGYYCFGLSPFDRLINDENTVLLTFDYSRLLGGVWVNILLSAIVLPLGFIVYKKRDKSTLTHNVYAKPFMLGVMSLVAIFAIMYGIEADIAYVPYAMLFAGCAVFALVFKRMGFKIKENLGWLIGYAGVIAGFMAICAIAYFTEGFGLPKRPLDLVGRNYCVNVSFAQKDEFGRPRWDLLNIEDVDMSELDSIVADVSEICEGSKNFYNFCEYSGLVSKESSQDYIYVTNDNDNLADSRYYYNPYGYEAIEISIRAYYTAEEWDKMVGNDEDLAANHIEFITLTMYIKNSDFEKIETMMKQKHRALDYDEYERVILKRNNPEMTDEEIDALIEKIHRSHEEEQEEYDPEEEDTDE